MEENRNALDEVNKGCTMGIEAINNLMSKVDNNKFRSSLEKELNEYKKIEDEIQDVYKKYSGDDPHEISPMSKIMTEYMMNIKTLTNHSDSKIAEILLQGTNMGIIEGRRILNNKKMEFDVENILKEFVGMQERLVENFKEYL